VTADLEAERRARLAAALDDLRAVAPTWVPLFEAYVLHGLYERTVLDHRTRELCAVAALAALGREGPLADHLKGALRHGATPEEALEPILQASVYGGFPVALAGIRTYRRVLDELGLAPGSGLHEGGDVGDEVEEA
jgi:4-carboxymuconolactone decarboxylase